MSLPKVQLEVWLPKSKIIHVPAELANVVEPNRPNKDEDVSFPRPRIWKMSLTEESEKEIFGDVSPWRTAAFPPLCLVKKWYEKKLAVIEEDQVEIYNAHIERVFHDSTAEKIAEMKVTAGSVEIFRANHNVRLKNVET